MRVNRVGIMAAAAIVLALSIAALLVFRIPVTTPAADADPSVSASPNTGGLPQRPTEVSWQAPVALLDLASPLVRVDGLVEAPNQLIAWGRIPAPGRNQFNDLGAVFISADGREWRAIPIDHGVNAASSSELTGIAVGDGSLLAYGGVCCDPEARAIWRSNDGESWERLMIDGAIDPTGMFITHIVAWHGSWVAAAADGVGGSILTSVDGETWVEALNVDNGFPGAAVMDVTTTETGLVAVGTVVGPDGTYDGAVWRSDDAAHWERLGDTDPALSGDGENRLDHVVAFGGGLFIFGSHGTSEDREGCEQLGTASLVSWHGGVHKVIDCFWGRDHVWTSVDGQAWRRVDVETMPGLHPIEFREVASDGTDLLVLGESSAPASPDTMLFASSDGIVWRPVGPDQPMLAEIAMGLMVRERTIVALTQPASGATDFRIWIGARH